MNNKSKVILDLAGGTGAWSKDYKENGYTVYNITLPDYDIRDYTIYKIHGDWMICFNSLIDKPDIHIRIKDIYGILAAPPCTQFSFARTTAKKPMDLKGGMKIVIACLEIIWQCQYNIKSQQQRKAPLKFWALENPYGRLNWFLGKPAFIFQPYEFGDGYSKRTCLWGNFNNPEKQMTFRFIKNKFEDIRCGKLREIHKTRTKGKTELRSITPAGFAKAFYEANR